jgi:hypothetical protein
MIHGVAVSRATGWPFKQKMKRCSNNLQRFQLILSPHMHYAQQRQASARISSRNERIPEESKPKQAEHRFACITTGCKWSLHCIPCLRLQVPRLRLLAARINRFNNKHTPDPSLKFEIMKLQILWEVQAVLGASLC